MIAVQVSGPLCSLGRREPAWHKAQKTAAIALVAVGTKVLVGFHSDH